MIAVPFLINTFTQPATPIVPPEVVNGYGAPSTVIESPPNSIPPLHSTSRTAD